MARRRALRLSLALTAGLLLGAPGVQAKTFTYKIKHEHTVGSCQGELVIGETDIRFEADNRKDSRIWAYTHIKKIERPDLNRLTLYTYEDQTWQFGRDRPFDFTFLDGSVTDEVFSFIVTRISHNEAPPTPPSPPGGRFELAAKHLHTFGGCEGTLKISDTYIEYVTRSKDSRLWKYLDIKRFDHQSTYRLDLYTYEDQTWQLGRDKGFRFQLKEALEPQVYEFMRSRLTGPAASSPSD